MNHFKDDEQDLTATVPTCLLEKFIANITPGKKVDIVELVRILNLDVVEGQFFIVHVKVSVDRKGVAKILKVQCERPNYHVMRGLSIYKPKTDDATDHEHVGDEVPFPTTTDVTDASKVKKIRRWLSFKKA